jgi:DNA-directed RNA polymerase specialized sigma24 family protein
MESNDSVTRWLDGVKTGEDESTSRFVERFYDPIVRLVQRRLPAVARRGGDEEDVALSALRSFLGRVQQGQFSRLENRDDLWRILVTISKRKAAKHIARETAEKRGGGKVRGESVFLRPGDDPAGGLDEIAESRPTAQEQCELLDCVEQILSFLEELDDETLRAIAVFKSHGIGDTQIARELNCSTRTVERKRKRLREKAEKWATRNM